MKETAAMYVSAFNKNWMHLPYVFSLYFNSFLRVDCFPFRMRNTNIPSKNILFILNLFCLKRKERVKIWGKCLEIWRTTRKWGINIIWEEIRGFEELDLYIEDLVIKTLLPSWGLTQVRKGEFSLSPWEVTPVWHQYSNKHLAVGHSGDWRLSYIPNLDVLCQGHSLDHTCDFYVHFPHSC